MAQQPLEGSQAIAQAVALCRPQVVAAYPITPQTHIVENLAKLIADGKLACELVSVESEFSAASVVLGAAAAGSRAYTATSSQGLLLMTEVLFNIAGLRVPLVLTCANRTVGAPVSLGNDHQDSMAVRDAGWVQLYCADNQEAIDTTIHAFRIAERCELPVMVCVDGFTLTHTLEPLEVPAQQQVDNFVGPYAFARTLKPTDPITLGTVLSHEFYPEVRHAHHRALLDAQEEIVAADREWHALTGRSTGGLLSIEGPPDAQTAILTIGSILGTLADAQAEYRDQAPAKLIKLRAFRPFPVDALKQACEGLRELVVVERAVSLGSGGIIAAEVRAALSEMSSPPRVHSYAIGLGGRDVPMNAYPKLVAAAQSESPPRFAIFDLQPAKLPAEDR